MNNRQTLDKWREFYAAALFDLPAAAVQSLLPGTDRQDREERLGTIAWRAYDAWIWLEQAVIGASEASPAGPPSTAIRRAISGSREPRISIR